MIAAERERHLSMYFEWRCDECLDVFAHCPKRLARLSDEERAWLIEEEHRRQAADEPDAVSI